MSTLYKIASGMFATGAIDWSADDFGVAMIDENYTLDTDNQYLAEIEDYIVGSKTLYTLGPIDGACDASDLFFESVEGNDVTALVIYLDTGDSATSELIAYLDEDISGLPYVPIGDTVKIQWDNGQNRVFRL